MPLWIAFVLGRRVANKRYTYGYGRSEDLAGLFVLAMIAFSSVLAAWQSIDRLLHPQPVSNLGLLAMAGVIGFAGNELVALYRIRVGKDIGSACPTATSTVSAASPSSSGWPLRKSGSVIVALNRLLWHPTTTVSQSRL